jgi:hypothetical protein
MQMHRPLYYVLEGHEVRPVEDVLTWGEWMRTAERRVEYTTLPSGTEVSTVFIGLDHSFREGPPVLFETLVFGGPCDGEMSRYATWQEATIGHAVMVAAVEATEQLP